MKKSIIITSLLLISARDLNKLMSDHDCIKAGEEAEGTALIDLKLKS